MIGSIKCLFLFRLVSVFTLVSIGNCSNRNCSYLVVCFPVLIFNHTSQISSQKDFSSWYVFLSLLACLEFTVVVPYNLKIFPTSMLTLLMLIILTITEPVSQRETWTCCETFAGTWNLRWRKLPIYSLQEDTLGSWCPADSRVTK